MKRRKLTLAPSQPGHKLTISYFVYFFFMNLIENLDATFEPGAPAHHCVNDDCPCRTEASWLDVLRFFNKDIQTWISFALFLCLSEFVFVNSSHQIINVISSDILLAELDQLDEDLMSETVKGSQVPSMDMKLESEDITCDQQLYDCRYNPYLKLGVRQFYSHAEERVRYNSPFWQRVGAQATTKNNQNKQRLTINLGFSVPQNPIGVETSFQAQLLDFFKQQVVVSGVREIESRNVIILGPPGIGKTYASSSLSERDMGGTASSSLSERDIIS